jgi:hypothetical protein
LKSDGSKRLSAALVPLAIAQRVHHNGIVFVFRAARGEVEMP